MRGFSAVVTVTPARAPLRRLGSAGRYGIHGHARRRFRDLERDRSGRPRRVRRARR